MDKLDELKLGEVSDTSDKMDELKDKFGMWRVWKNKVDKLDELKDRFDVLYVMT